MAEFRSPTPADPLMNSYHSADAERIADLFYGNAEAPKFGGRRWTAAFPEVNARQLQILQTGRSANPDVVWSVDEIRLRRGGACLSAARSWRLDAFPNPWDIGFAFRWSGRNQVEILGIHSPWHGDRDTFGRSSIGRRRGDKFSRFAMG